MSDLIGKVIEKYEVVKEIGAGGMATVYLARDQKLERDVAIKVIQIDAFPEKSKEQILGRFRNEAKALSKLQHPNIVGIIDYGEYEGTPYLVMDYVSGGTLRQRLGQPVGISEAIRIIKPIAEALGYAHQQGIIHRDVKPSNILISQSGDPMLSDFGVAKVIEESDEGHTLTGTGMGVGTPEYMSPEQGLGKKVDGRADIYSLGIILYELLTGERPYTAGTPMEVFLKQTTEPLPDMSYMPGAVQKVLKKALDKKPERRYRSMGEFVKATSKIGKQIGHSFQDIIIRDNPKRIQKNHDKTNKRLLYSLCGVIASLFIGVVIFFNLNHLQFFPAQVGAPTQIPSQTTNDPAKKTEELTTSPSITPIPTKTIQVKTIPTQIVDPLPKPQFDLITLQNIKDLYPIVKITEMKEDTNPLPAEFSPDGKYIMIKNIFDLDVYSTKDGSLVNKLARNIQDKEIYSMTFSNTGEMAAFVLGMENADVFGFLNRLEVWIDATSKKPGMKSFTYGNDYGKLITNIYPKAGISFSPDDKFIATGTEDHKTIIFSIATSEISKEIPYSTYQTAIQYSPDGKILAVGYADTSIHLYQISDKKLVGHNGPIYDLTFSPDGKYLVSISSDPKAIVWDVVKGEKIFELQDQNLRLLQGVDYSADGSIIATSGYNQNKTELIIDFWNASDGKLVYTMRPPLGNPFISFSPDGYTLSAQNSGLGLFQVRSNDYQPDPAILNQNLSIETTIRYSTDMQSAYTANVDGVMLFDVWKGKLIKKLDIPYWSPSNPKEFWKMGYCDFEISKYEERILSRTSENSAAVFSFGGKEIYRIDNIEVEGKWKEIHLTPDGKLVTISNQNNFLIIDIDTKETILTSEKNGKLIFGSNIQISPNSEYAITQDMNSAISDQRNKYLWRLSDGSLIKKYSNVGSITFTNDSENVIYTSEGKLMVKSIEGNEFVTSIQLKNIPSPKVIAINLNNTFVAVASQIADDQNVFVYELASGDLITTEKKEDFARIIIDETGKIIDFNPTLK